MKVYCWFQRGLCSLQTQPESEVLQLAQPSRRSHYFILSSAIINHRFALPITSAGRSPQMNLGAHASGLSVVASPAWLLRGHRSCIPGMQSGAPSSQTLWGAMGPAFQMKSCCKPSSGDSGQIARLHFHPRLGYPLGTSNEAVRKNSTGREACPHSLHSLPLDLGLNPHSMTSLTIRPWENDPVLSEHASFLWQSGDHSTYLSEIRWGPEDATAKDLGYGC